jgi:hypothetical protein
MTRFNLLGRLINRVRQLRAKTGDKPSKSRSLASHVEFERFARRAFTSFVL